MSHLFTKLLVLVVALTLIGLSLLVIRQERYMAAARLTRHHRELQQTERQVWELQAELARRVTPQRLRELAEKHGLSAPRPRLRGEALAVQVVDPLAAETTQREVAAAPLPEPPGAPLALVGLTTEEKSEADDD